VPWTYSSLSTTWAVPESFPESTPSFSGRMVIPTAVYGVKQSSSSHRSSFMHPLLGGVPESTLIMQMARERRGWLGNSSHLAVRGVWIEFKLIQADNPMRWIVYISDYPQNTIVLIIYGYSGINYRLNVDFQPIDKHSLGVSLKNRQILSVDAWCMVLLSCHNQAHQYALIDAAITGCP